MQAGEDNVSDLAVAALVRAVDVMQVPAALVAEAEGSRILSASTALKALADAAMAGDPGGTLQQLIPQNRPKPDGTVERAGRRWRADAVADGLTLWQVVPGGNPGIDDGADVQDADTEALVSQLASVVRSTDTQGMGIYYFGPDRRLKAWNPGLEKLFPESDDHPVPNGLIEDQIDALIDNRMISALDGRIDEFRSNLLGSFSETGIPLVDLTASGVWATASTCHLPGLGWLQVLVDISSIKHREERLRNFMANAPDMLFTRRRAGTDVTTFWGSLANKLVRDFGGERGRVRPQNWYTQIDDADRSHYVQTMERHRSDLQPFSLSFGLTNPRSGEHRFYREDGWVTRDRLGDMHHESVVVDITELKCVQAQLQQSEKRFRDFAELASDWFFELDGDLRFTYISERFESIFGVPREKMLGRALHDVSQVWIASVPDSRLGVQDLMDAVDAHQPMRNHLLHLPADNGKVLVVSISADVSQGDDGTFAGYRGIGRNVTDLVRAREQALAALDRSEQANQAKSAFVARMSHELRTPLNAIIGFSGIIASELFGPVGNERYAEYVRDIEQSGRHLLSLVNDILDLSRIEADALELEPVDMDLAQEIDQIAKLLREDLKDRVLAVDIPDACTVHADRRALHQMLINLLGNAVKFTVAGDQIRVTAQRAGDGGCTLSVADTGPGIAAAEIEIALEPFGRTKAAETKPGTGLGLPLTSRLMEMHGGALKLESTPGVGTTVTLLFPPVDHEGQAPQPS